MATLSTSRSLPLAVKVRSMSPAVVVALAYTLTALLGLRLALGNENVTVFWPPTGISVAALLLLGNRVWPGIAAGAVIANVANGAPPQAAVAIAAGNTLAPLMAAWALKKIRVHLELDRAGDVIALFFVGGFASMLVSAAGGTAALRLTGLAQNADLPGISLVWWVGDAMGVVLVAPLVLVFRDATPTSPSRAAWLELALLTVLAGGGTYLLFDHLRVPIGMLVVLVGVWAAIRLEQRGAAVVAFVASTAATLATSQGQGPFSLLAPTPALLSLQTFNLALAISSLIPAAVMRQQRSAKDKLARSAMESLAEAQALSHVGSWRWEVSGNRVVWSDELYRIYGLDRGSFAATFEAYLERVHPEHLEGVRTAVTRACSEFEPFEHEYRIVRPSGEERWVHARAEPVVVDGRLCALRGYCQDVTEQRRSQEMLRDALEREREVAVRLRSLDEMKNAFLGAISHELRTPLSVVLGLTDSLQSRLEEIPHAKTELLLERIAANARRLEHLLVDVLDVDRLTRGIIEARRRPVDVAALVRRVTEGADGLGAERVSVDAEAVTASLDPGLVERIVENLLTNAARHTPPHTPIWVCVRDEPAGVVIIVEDAGPGVPDELKTTIFEPFRQGNGATRGTGIGLSLAERFAALHGGVISVKDRPGGGASFRVLLPREDAPNLATRRSVAVQTA